MLYDSKDHIDSCMMMRELISSVRDTSRRLSEVKMMIKGDFIKEEKKDEVKARYLALMNTRFCLIYSIYDIRQRFVKKISDKNTKEKVEKRFQIDGLFHDLSSV